MKEFSYFPVMGNINTGVYYPSDYVDVIVLAQNTEEKHDVPDGAKIVLFKSSGDEFWAKAGVVNATAAIPASDVTDGTGSVKNPVGWYIEDMAKISFIASPATTISLEYFK